MSVVEDSGEEMSPVVRSRMQRNMSQTAAHGPNQNPNQKRVHFDENLNVQRTYEDFQPNSASDDSDVSDDDPPTPPAPIIDDISMCQPEPVNNDATSPANSAHVSKQNDLEDVLFGFSFETQDDQLDHSQTATDTNENTGRASRNSQDSDVVVAVHDQASIKQLDTETSEKESSVQPAEVKPAPMVSSNALSADHSNDPTEGETSAVDDMELDITNQTKAENSPIAAEVHESYQARAARDNAADTRQLTQTACHQTEHTHHTGRRQSQRKKFRPLAFHLGERVHYQRGAAVCTLNPKGGQSLHA